MRYPEKVVCLWRGHRWLLFKREGAPLAERCDRCGEIRTYGWLRGGR
jgi:hypothetical protein